MKKEYNYPVIKETTIDIDDIIMASFAENDPNEVNSDWGFNTRI